MRKSGLVLFITMTVLLMFCASAQALRLPDTGQTTCFDSAGNLLPSCVGTGQDGAYVKARGYSENANRTVTDNVTGLVWQKCSADQTGNDCSGNWAQGHNWYEASGTYHETYNKYSKSICGDLGEGWRLPHAFELQTLVDYSIIAGYDIPTIDPIFPNTAIDYYWTADVFANNEDYAWNVNFLTGAVRGDNTLKTTSLPVRCVYGERPLSFFRDNGDGTVTDYDQVHDSGTGLMWQKCSAGQNNDSTCSGVSGNKTWEQALTYCNNLTWGNKTGWRLPDIMELRSLTDRFSYNPAIDGIFFPNTPSEQYWSSTSYLDLAWLVGFLSGATPYKKKTSLNHVRCVRGPFTITAKATGTGSGWISSRLSSTYLGIYYYYPDEKNGSYSFGAGIEVDIDAKASQGSTASWGGTCATAGGTEEGNDTGQATCTITTKSDASITATFICPNKPVRIAELPGDDGYYTITAAMGAIVGLGPGKATIWSRGTLLSEHVDFKLENISLDLIGGCDCDFQTNNGFFTTLEGSVTVGGDGKLKMHNFKIK
jgi:hypothetical protein